MTIKVDFLVWLGAGDGSTQLSLPDAEKIFVVDANKSSLGRLDKIDGNGSDIEKVHAVISQNGQSGEATWYELSDSSFSAISKPTGVFDLLPGLELTSETKVEAISAIDLFEQLFPQGPEGKLEDKKVALAIELNGLGVDVALTVLNSPWVEYIESLQLVLSSELYEQCNSLSEAASQLEELGFIVTNVNDSDMDFPVITAKANPLANELQKQRQKVTNLEAALAKSQQNHEALELKSQQLLGEKDKLESKNRTLEKQLLEAKESTRELETKLSAGEKQLVLAKDARTDLDAKLAFTNSELAETRTELEAKTQKLAEAYQRFTNSKAEAEVLKSKLEAAEEKAKLENQISEHLSSKFEALASKMQVNANDQMAHITNAANALGQHVTQKFSENKSSLNQVLQLDRVLPNGTLGLEFDDWSIGPDLALELQKLISGNAYTTVVEFGAGASTILFAKAYADHHDSSQYTALESQSSKGLTTSRDVLPIIPNRIISFEQDQSHLEHVRGNLEKQKLDELVELVFAPLVTSDSDINFYSCERKLFELANTIDHRSAKLLVLVDGPFIDGAENCRQPALEMLLKFFPAVEIDLVLDDCIRDGEQAILENWQSELTKMGLRFEVCSLSTERQAMLIQVNKK